MEATYYVRVQSVGFRVQGFGFRVQGQGFVGVWEPSSQSGVLSRSVMEEG